jgi:rod shape-determining protein MreC
VNRNGLRTIAIGTGTINQLELPYLPNNADIREGDLLVTSGLGQVYPPGYPVATITAIVRNPGSLFANIAATPTAHLDRSREVLLVWSQSPGQESDSIVDTNVANTDVTDTEVADTDTADTTVTDTAKEESQ